jgi:hypothetical protein
VPFVYIIKLQINDCDHKARELTREGKATEMCTSAANKTTAMSELVCNRVDLNHTPQTAYELR